MVGSHFQAQASKVQKEGHESMKRMWVSLSKDQLCKDPQEEMSKGMKNNQLRQIECSHIEGATQKVAR